MKTLYRILVLANLAILSACSTGQNVAPDAVSMDAQAAGTAASTPSYVQIPATDQLLIGTLMLENHELAVMPEQAARLLPLWQLMHTLVTSETSVQAEIDAVLKQIDAEMTGEQLAWIAGQDFSGKSMFQVMQELGITPSGQAEPAAGGGPGSFEPGSGRPDFVPGSGDGGPGEGLGRGEGLTPEMQATRQAMVEANGGALQRRSNSALMDALITWLEARAAGPTP